MTLSSPILDRVEISSSVIPSAKYSSLGSGLMLAMGNTAIRCSSTGTGISARASAFASLGLGPDSQPLSPTPLSLDTMLTLPMVNQFLQFKQRARAELDSFEDTVPF